MNHLAELRAERARCEVAIADAYWAFTRHRRGRPPTLVVPWAYRRRTEIDRTLRRLARAERRAK